MRKDRVTPEVYAAVALRDGHCIGPRVGMPGPCHWVLELDHVRASGALSLRSRSTPDNLVMLCRDHHRLKTENGKTWRPAIIEYLRGEGA